MAARFEADGIAFRYPENWTLEREEHRLDGLSRSRVPKRRSSPWCCSWTTIWMRPPRPTVPSKRFGPTIPTWSRSRWLSPSPANQPWGTTRTFFSLDLTNTAGMRAFRAESGVVLLMWQLNDMELERYEPVLRAIRASIEEV